MKNRNNRVHDLVRLLRVLPLCAVLWLAGCSNPDTKTRNLMVYTGSGTGPEAAVARPVQEVQPRPPMTPEGTKALNDLLGYIRREADQARTQDNVRQARAEIEARVRRSASGWNAISGFPLLFTGLGAATGALIGSTRAKAWEGALIGATAGGLIDVGRRRSGYPFGAGMVLGTGVGAVVGESAGNTAGGAIIGGAAGLALDSLITATSDRE